MVVLANPVHPGEILAEDYLAELGLTAGKLARAIGVPRTRIERLVERKTSISLDTALRLSRYFATTPELWLNLQTAYDLAVTRSNPTLMAELEDIQAFAAEN